MSEKVTDIEEVIRTILLRNQELSDHNSALEVENADLRNRLTRYEQPEKDSHNSSIPSSRESLKAQGIRRTRSLRTPSGKTTGGQLGHAGSTVSVSQTPDQVISHASDYCLKCGHSLSGISGKVIETRQSIDIPLPVCPVVSNHVRLEKQCTCGQCNKGTFPSYVKSGVSYGINLHAVVAYLSVVQHIPFKRLVSTLKDFYGIEISQGSVANILNRMRKQSKQGYDAIKRAIEVSAVVGADETGEKLNGKLHWMWTFQNDLVTYIFQDPSRGKAAIDKHFPDGLPLSVLVTDRHSSYFNMDVAGHQLCLAHLLRELIYLGELDTEQKWSSDLLNLLRETIHKRKTLPLTDIDIGSIKGEFANLMKVNLDRLNQKFGNLQKSLIKHADHLFNFLEQEDVPYENNASERSVRPLKVKQKVSGQFKTENGANAFCQLHSIAETAKKNGQDIFLAFIAVANNCCQTRGAE